MTSRRRGGSLSLGAVLESTWGANNEQHSRTVTVINSDGTILTDPLSKPPTKVP